MPSKSRLAGLILALAAAQTYAYVQIPRMGAYDPAKIGILTLPSPSIEPACQCSVPGLLTNLPAGVTAPLPRLISNA